MNNTLKSAGNTIGGGKDFGQTGQSFGSNNPASLKGKLMSLEVLQIINNLIQESIKGVQDEMNFHKKEVQILKSEKDTLESVLSMKT